MLEARRGFGILNAFWLKIIVAVLMVLDHVYLYLQYYLGFFPETPLYWAHIASRVVAPVFAFLVTEGLVHTSNRKKYILRILAFGLAMMLGNAIFYAIYGDVFAWFLYLSILMALAIGAALVAFIDNAIATENTLHRVLWILGCVGLFIACFFFEGTYLIPMMVVIFYYLRSRPIVMWIVFFVLGCTPYLISLFRYGELDPQFWMILAIIPIMLYNGQRGPNGKVAKYFFYVFYPLHLWIIFLVEHYLLRS